jgi:serine/threonine-protein kinase
LDRIAEGGMGEVYRAKMETLGGAEKVVALKVVRKDLAENEEFASLFIDEARLAMGLSHVNVVQSFDAGRIDDQLFLAMEYVAGFHFGDLLQACMRRFRQPLPHKHLIYIAVEVLKGLDYAHRRVDSNERSLGIVHRDVSPGNILISLEGEVKVADFGIAKSVLRSGQTIGGRVKGKLPYIAPEQLRESGVDRRTDIYSLGAVMYEALTDRWLVDANDTEGAIRDILDGRFVRPREVNADIPEALEAIVLRALRLDTSERYPNAPAMRQELERYAFSGGYLLSSADLAEFLEAICSDGEEWKAARILRSTEPPGRSSLPPAEAPVIEPFNALLGAELRKINTSNAYSVFTTGEVVGLVGTGPVGPTVDEAPPPRKRRLGWVLFAATVLALLAFLGMRPRLEPDAAPASADTRASKPVAPSRIEAGPPSVVPSEATAVAAVDESAAADVEPIEATIETKPRTVTRKEPRRAPKTVAPEPAFVSVNSDPWSYVEIDGKRIRTTPLRAHRVAPGTHRIVLRNPDAGLERRLDIDVAPGERKRLSIDLRGSP